MLGCPPAPVNRIRRTAAPANRGLARTREIGVRMAMGATRADIRRHFLAEAVTLTALSGLLGFTVGIGLCLALRSLPLPEYIPHPAVSTTAIFASLTTLSTIAIFAGLYPAERAAALAPVECLRYE